MEKELRKIELNGVICRHNIPVRDSKYGTTTRVVVFINPVHNTRTFCWRTTSSEAYRYKRGQAYDIEAQIDHDDNLQRVKLIYDYKDTKTGEQNPITPVNALDIFLGENNDTNLTYNYNYDIIKQKGVDKSERNTI